MRRIDVGNHDQVTVSFQTTLEQMRQFRVPVLDVGALLLAVVVGSERVDAIGQSQQRLINVRALLETYAAVVGRGGALATCEIDEIHFALRDGLPPAVRHTYMCECQLQNGV